MIEAWQLGLEVFVVLAGAASIQVIVIITLKNVE